MENPIEDLKAQITALRETNRKLNRRCQFAESCLEKISKRNVGYANAMSKKLEDLQEFSKGWRHHFVNMKRLMNVSTGTETILRERIITLETLLEQTVGKEWFNLNQAKIALRKLSKLVHELQLSQGMDAKADILENIKLAIKTELDRK